MTGIITIVVLLGVTVLAAQRGDAYSENEETGTKVVINSKIYGNIFLRRREEHRGLLKHFLEMNNYAQSYKLLHVGLDKILTVIGDNRMILEASHYSPTNGFPTTNYLVDSLALVLENTCLFGEMLLYMPDMASDILRKYPDWKKTMFWSIEMLRQNDDVIDKKTLEMINLFEMEIRPELRTEDYVNPYMGRLKNDLKETDKKQKKKKKKTIKKGPQLVGGNGEKVEL